MQAIHVKYMCPTNSRGSRLKATCAAGSVSIPFPHEIDGQQAQCRAAADALCAKMGWNDGRGAMLGGCLPDGSYCFVFDHAQSRI